MEAWPTRIRLAARCIALALLVALGAVDGAHAQFAEEDLVGVELVADVHAIAPGRPFHLGVRFDIADGWHVNWINPGDAGLAPSVAWMLPPGFEAAALEWPFPRRYVEEGPLVIFGYSGRLILWTTVTPPADLRPGAPVSLRAGVDWLACRDVCVPGASDVTLELPVEDVPRRDTDWAQALDDFTRQIPAVSDEWHLRATYDERAIVLEITPVRPRFETPPVGVFFFPFEQGVIENAQAQVLDAVGSGLHLTIERARMALELPARLSGVLVSESGWGAGTPGALQVDVVLEPR